MAVASCFEMHTSCAPSHEADQGFAPASRARHIGVREEQLLAADLVAGNRLLSFRRNQPVDEGLAQFLLHVRMFGRVHEDHAILVEHALVAGDQVVEFAAVLECQPVAAVCQHIGI
jgi:hypothetical protein